MVVVCGWEAEHERESDSEMLWLLVVSMSMSMSSMRDGAMDRIEIAPPANISVFLFLFLEKDMMRCGWMDWGGRCGCESGSP